MTTLLEQFVRGLCLPIAPGRGAGKPSGAEEQELELLKKRVAVDDQESLAPEPSPSFNWKPRFSIADLLAILTLTPLNMVLAGRITLSTA